MNWIKAIFVVLRQGEALSNVKTWKDRHQAINALLGILAVATPVLAHYGLVVSPEDAASIAAGVAAVGGLVTAYLVPATTDKTGLPPKREDPYDPSDTDNVMG